MRDPVVYTLPASSGLEPVKLTQRQAETLRVIARLSFECGYPPSGTEIADAMSPRLSTQGLFDKLNALRGKNLITSTYGVHRSIRLTPEGRVILAAVEASNSPALVEVAAR